MQTKDFVVENGQMYYKKKPLYKQPLFWTTIAGAHPRSDLFYFYDRSKRSKF
ncbi:hypothetical protein Q7V23_09100 [Streptococcus suis]|nr:hypothetical protein [Streptococcus suis]MDW8590171.1 hypothetical protein [Streptococcus suis]MDW8615943.1 hypothetical protein [Streptococcus suis]